MSLLSLLFFGCNDNTIVTPQSEIPTSIYLGKDGSIKNTSGHSNIAIKDRTSTDLVTARITNFIHNQTEGNFQFDIECKVDSPNGFEMGNTTFMLETNMSNPRLTYKNPRYITGNGSGYYDMYAVQVGSQFSVQIVYFANQGTASALQTKFERIATIKLEVNEFPSLTWNPSLSFMMNPSYDQALFNLEGSFTKKINIRK